MFAPSNVLLHYTPLPVTGVRLDYIRRKFFGVPLNSESFVHQGQRTIRTFRSWVVSARLILWVDSAYFGGPFRPLLILEIYFVRYFQNKSMFYIQFSVVSIMFVCALVFDQIKNDIGPYCLTRPAYTFLFFRNLIRLSNFRHPLGGAVILITRGGSNGANTR